MNPLVWLWRWFWIIPLLILGLLVLLGYLFTEAGRFVATPIDQASTGDLIVSLGGGPVERDQFALAIIKQGLTDRLFLTEMRGNRYQFYLEHGVKPEKIIIDDHSTSSWDEAMVTFSLMQQQGWNRVLVVSDPPHMRRLSWIWTHVFAGSGKRFLLLPAPVGIWQEKDWWRSDWSRDYVLLELKKLVFYMLRYGGEGPEWDLPRRNRSRAAPPVDSDRSNASVSE